MYRTPANSNTGFSLNSFTSSSERQTLNKKEIKPPKELKEIYTGWAEQLSSKGVTFDGTESPDVNSEIK